MGNLVPIMVQEVVPGDKFKVNTELMLRLQPLVAPIYHRLKVKTEFFFVPNRLVYSKWQEFITGGDTGVSTEEAPYIQVSSGWEVPYLAKGSLADYMGIPPFDPTSMAAPLKINALPFRAYQLIYNEYYRDQNLQQAVPVTQTGGMETNPYGMLTMQKCAWEKDYFTSCLPWAQKSGQPVNVPTTVNYKPQTIQIDTLTGLPVAGQPTANALGEFEVSTQTDVRFENLQDIGITINDLRTSARVQEWLEKTARAGSRYIETILSFFGVMSSDARLQRPEYLGGSTQPIVVSEVLSTFQAGDDTGYPQGNMTGHGISAGNVNGFSRGFEEHGFIIGLMRVLPTTAYQQGINKMFSRFDKFDYYWPTFAQLGEQEVKVQELYYDKAASAVNEETFGYQSRYADYKFQPSTVHGDFRDNLDFWHMGRIFTAKPNLNTNFITADPTKRVFAVTAQEEDEILCQVYHRVDALRPMPYFNNPTL
jgi:hypothetical protein